MLLIRLKNGMSSALWSMSLKVCPWCGAVFSMRKCIVTVAMNSHTTGKYKYQMIERCILSLLIVWVKELREPLNRISKLWVESNVHGKPQSIWNTCTDLGMDWIILIQLNKGGCLVVQVSLLVICSLSVSIPSLWQSSPLTWLELSDENSPIIIYLAVWNKMAVTS